jgi:hypothetical protein
LLTLCACQAEVCAPGSVHYVASPDRFPEPTSADAEPTPTLIEIGTKTVEVDRVIHGPLCDDTWSGTVYVACDVQVVAWTQEKGSTFLDGCDLTIEPGTVVYVAAHNNAAYYKGCASCHTTGGATPSP